MGRMGRRLVMELVERRRAVQRGLHHLHDDDEDDIYVLREHYCCASDNTCHDEHYYLLDICCGHLASTDVSSYQPASVDLHSSQLDQHELVHVSVGLPDTF